MRLLLLLWLLFTITDVPAQSRNWSIALAKTATATWTDPASVPQQEALRQGDYRLLFKGFENLWMNTGDVAYYNHIRKSLSSILTEDGSNNEKKGPLYNEVPFTAGSALLTLYRVSLNDKYLKAVRSMIDPLRKEMKPTGLPVLAEYAMLANDTMLLNEVTQRFLHLDTGWNQEAVSALVEALDFFPEENNNRKGLIGIFKRNIASVLTLQHPVSGLWNKRLPARNKDTRKDYPDLVSSCLYVYAIAKGIRKGYLPVSLVPKVQKGYSAIIRHFIHEEKGEAHLDNFTPTNEAGQLILVRDDIYVIGAFILAATEMDILPKSDFSQRPRVVLDNYFNRETKTNAFGHKIIYHYKWWEKDNGGYFLLGHIIQKQGAIPITLNEVPNQQNLSGAAVYIIVDPDWSKENPDPNYIDPVAVDEIYRYVKEGGVLVMMANDSGNVEFPHFNQLAQRFGIHWNENMRHDVINDEYQQAALTIPTGHPVFKHSRKVFIKQLCTQTIEKPAVSLYTETGEVLMSVAVVGKGKVFAVGDPWFYNEYLDGRKLPPEYENYTAAEDLIRWLLEGQKSRIQGQK